MKCNEKRIPFVEFIEFIINYDIEILCNYYLENNLIKSTSLIDSNDQIHSNGEKKINFFLHFSSRCTECPSLHPPNRQLSRANRRKADQRITIFIRELTRFQPMEFQNWRTNLYAIPDRSNARNISIVPVKTTSSSLP